MRDGVRGTGSNGVDVCSACPANTYKPAAGSDFSCTDCTNDRTTGGLTGKTALTDCNSCNAGYEGTLDAGSLTSCSACVRGTYKSSSGTGDCTPCSNGVTTGTDASPVTGATSASACNTCTPGWWRTTGASCQECPIGWYKSSAGNAGCSDCPQKTTTNGMKAQTDKTDCLCITGTHGNAGGPCEDCETGRYQGSNMLTVDTNCSTCGKGQAAFSRHSGCAPCAAGKYQERDVAEVYQCSFCSPGRGFVNQTTVCAPCGNGEVQPSSSASAAACQACTSGTQFVSSTQECQGCPPGKTYYDGSRRRRRRQRRLGGRRGARRLGNPAVCEFCPAGTSFTGVSTACETCSAGKYQDENSAAFAACKFCPAGRGFVNGSIACKPCPPGQYQNRNDLAGAQCAYCPVGMYFGGNAAQPCALCAAGKYQAEDDRVASALNGDTCHDCPNGKQIQYVSSDQASRHDQAEDCGSCGVGTAAVSSAHPCSACAIGLVQPLAVATAYGCAACTAGNEYVAIDQPCAGCAAGQYQTQNNAQSASCSHCSAGTAFVSVNQSCTSCTGGTYQARNDAGTDAICQYCAAGTYFVSASNVCNGCIAGRYQGSNTGAVGGQGVTCATCGLGQYARAANATACDACAFGQFQDDTPSTVWGDCKRCSAGRAYTSATTSCSTCLAGQHQPNDGTKANASCAFCAPGQYQAQTGQADCNIMTVGEPSCAPGRGYSSASATDGHLAGSIADDGVCTTCVAGTYKGSADASACLPMSTPACGPGEGYSSASAADQELFTGSRNDDGTCETCPSPHFYNAFTDTSKCYLYTCSVNGNRCSAGYTCCEATTQRCVETSLNTGCDPNHPDYPGEATPVACATGYKECAGESSCTSPDFLLVFLALLVQLADPHAHTNAHSIPLNVPCRGRRQRKWLQVSQDRRH